VRLVSQVTIYFTQCRFFPSSTIIFVQKGRKAQLVPDTSGLTKTNTAEISKEAPCPLSNLWLKTIIHSLLNKRESVRSKILILFISMVRSFGIKSYRYVLVEPKCSTGYLTQKCDTFETLMLLLHMC
jgi:hypothetical protein